MAGSGHLTGVDAPEGPQHVTVHGRDGVVVITGAALVEAMQGRADESW